MRIEYTATSYPFEPDARIEKSKEHARCRFTRYKISNQATKSLETVGNYFIGEKEMNYHNQMNSQTQYLS